MTGFNVTLADKIPSFEINLTPVEHVVRRTPLVAAGEYRCPIEHPQFCGGGPETCPYIVFPRSSVHLTTDRGQAEACTPNTVNLLDVGDCYSRKPISQEGADCDWLAVAPGLLREIVHAVFPLRGNDNGPVFNRAVVPVKASTFMAQRTFFSIIKKDPAIPPLQIEETIFRLLECVLSEAFADAHDGASLRKARRMSASRQREMIEHTKYILARQFHLPLSTADLADRVHCSAWHLSRSFHRMTGFTLHGYQHQLRLRTSLQLLSETNYSGTRIAARLGFSSHSHFSNAFRRQFGLTPSAFTRACHRDSLDHLHSMLDAPEHLN